MEGAFELSAWFGDAYPLPEPDLPQPVKGGNYSKKKLKVRGKFAEKSFVLRGSGSESSCPEAGYSNNEVGKSDTGESQTFPSGLNC